MTVENISVQNDGSMALLSPGHVNSRSLAANVAETMSVPDEATHVFFSASADFYVTYDGTTAAVPGDVDDGSAAELNPAVRYLSRDNTGRTLSIVAPADTIVTAAFYRS